MKYFLLDDNIGRFQRFVVIVLSAGGGEKCNNTKKGNPQIGFPFQNNHFIFYSVLITSLSSVAGKLQIQNPLPTSQAELII